VERRFSSPKIANSLSLINSLIYLRENLHSWNINNSSVNEAYLERLYDHRHIKSRNPSSPKKFEMEGLHNHEVEPRSKMEWSLSWKFLTPSSNTFMSRNHFSLSSSSLRKALKNPFKEFLQYLLHSFPYPIISILVEIDFLVKCGIYLPLFHQIFPREEIVHLWTIFCQLCRPVKPVFHIG
jgi:hypothetical protein